MRYFTNLILVKIGLLIVIFLSSCNITGPVEGLEIYVTSTDNAGSRSLYADPQNVKIAFTKLWFPTPETFTALKGDNPDHSMGQIFVNVTTDFSGLDFYKPLTRNADDPYIFDSASSAPFEPAALPGYDRVFHGVLMETVYFELEMTDYSIRWYTQDSGSYKAQDVLVNSGSGWEFAFIQRTMQFDFLNSRMEAEKVENVVTTDVSLVTRSERNPSDQYFENWYMNGTLDSGDYSYYVWAALGVYNYNESTTLRQYYLDDGSDLEDLTLVQYFRLTRDVPNDSNPTISYLGQEIVDGYWGNTGSLPPCPELNAGYNDDSYTNPNELWTFAESENEAQLYKIEILFHLDSSSGSIGGLGVDSDGDSLSASSSWADIVSYVTTNDDFISLCPITGGKETKFGWLDFNGVWQGEFSVDAGN